VADHPGHQFYFPEYFFADSLCQNASRSQAGSCRGTGEGDVQMKGYIVGNYSVTDEASYLNYIRGVGAVVARYGGRTLVADHELDVKEGEPKSIVVLVEFDSAEKANTFYNSPEYRAVIDFRKNGTNGWVAIAREFIPPGRP
jgi:uncharacterized protein (DUF1330 family)